MAFFFGSLTIREVLVVYLITLVIGNLICSVQSFIYLFIQAVFNHYFNTYAARFVEPVTSFLIGGPTFNAINAIFRVTPILNPSILGERIDTMIQIAGSSAVTSLTVAISSFIESIFRTCIDISVGVGIAASNAVSNLIGGALGRSLKIDYIRSELRPKSNISKNVKMKNENTEPLIQPVAVASKTMKPIKNFNSIEKLKKSNSSHSEINTVDSDLKNTTGLSAMDRSTGRIYSERVKAASSPYDVTGELLERNPLLERFLEAVNLDEDDCLKEVICSISSSADENLAKEEVNFKIHFRALTKKYKAVIPALTSFVTAANTGQKEKSLKFCQAAYPKCTYPLLARALFIYLARFTSNK